MLNHACDERVKRFKPVLFVLASVPYFLLAVEFLGLEGVIGIDFVVKLFAIVSVLRSLIRL